MVISTGGRAFGAALALSAGVVGAQGLAVEASFSNHLTSPVMVSPAQIYQTKQLKTDFALGYSNQQGTTTPDGGNEAKSTVTGTNIFAAGIYNIEQVGVRAGLSVNYTTGSLETDSADKTTDTTNVIVTPQVAYSIGPVVVGAAYDFVQDSKKAGDTGEISATHTTFRPGVLYTAEKMEVGLAYATPYRNNGSVEDKEAPVQEPARVILHGRYGLNEEIVVGGIFENQNTKAIDEDARTDRQIIKGTMEYGTGALKIEGGAGYNTASYKEKETMNEDNIGTFALSGGADYTVNEMATVGGGLGYEFGSDSNDQKEVAKNILTLSVRGNMHF